MNLNIIIFFIFPEIIDISRGDVKVRPMRSVRPVRDKNIHSQWKNL